MTVLAVFLLAGISASAQAKWGVTAGLNFNTSKFSEVDVKARTGWSVGGTCLVDLPLGFSVQPSLLYHQKGANITNELSQSMGFLELPVSVQWGPDLLLFRPFLDVSPFVGYGINTKVKSDFTKGALQDSLNRLEYGVGVGVGLDVWRLQLIARYNWNFGPILNQDDYVNFDIIPDAGFGKNNFRGVTLSLALLF